MNGGPPLVCRALAVRAAFRAAPFAFVLVVLAVARASGPTLGVCASLAAAAAGAAFVERLAVVRAWGREGSWRCAVEAALASAFLYAGAIANATWWLGAPAQGLQARIDAALAGDVQETLFFGLVSSWVLAAPSGLLARLERLGWPEGPEGPGQWRDEGTLRTWLVAWNCPIALLVGVLTGPELSPMDPVKGIGQGAAVAVVSIFLLGMVETIGVVVLLTLDDLAWRWRPEASSAADPAAEGER